MTGRLVQNKLFMVLALAALAIAGVGVASAAMGGISTGGTVSNLTQPREGAELVDGYVAWEIHDRSGALVSTGGSANEITQAGLDYLLGRVGVGGQYTHIGILQGGSCTLAAYDADCALASGTDFTGDRVLVVTDLIGPVDGDDAALPAAAFTAAHRVKGVASGAFEADADSVSIDGIVLTSSSAGGTKPLASTLFAFNDTGWSVPTAGSTITFRWYIGVLDD